MGSNIRIAACGVLLALLVGLSVRPAAAAERKYAPDRVVDVLHLSIDVTPDFGKCTVVGRVDLTCQVMAESLRKIRLNAYNLDVAQISSSQTVESWSNNDKEINIYFSPPVPPGTELSITVEYRAEPTEGLYFRTPQMGYPQGDTHLWTQGESHFSPHWFPCHDYPNEKSTTEVTCRVPNGMTVLSNGKLVSEQADPVTGLVAVRWLQDKPHANYLVALTAGYFKKVESSFKGIPLAFYTPASRIQYAQKSFEGTDEVMEFLEQETGVPYPWQRYDQIVVDDFTAEGMENTTLAILYEGTLHTAEYENLRSSLNLVCHELNHMWFGNYVTCKDWSHLWINEGFAVYYNHLFNGHKFGRDEMLYNLFRTARGVLAERKVHLPIVYDRYEHAENQFDYRAYNKGGWVLHMIRTMLGPDLFRSCVKTFLERHAMESVVTDDFRQVLEEKTGRTFDRFFDQWLYHTRHPDLEISYEWLGQQKLVKLTVEQTQEVNEQVLLFYLPTKVRLITGGQVVDHQIVVERKKQDFYFASPDGEPQVVRFDPDFGLLANVEFSKPQKMLLAQLQLQDDVIGRLRACHDLWGKKDAKTVEALKIALNSDSFYGVQREAAGALSKVHTDEAFQALAVSTRQQDSRVRQTVVNALARFYRAEIPELFRTMLTSEKNPDIVYALLRGLGSYTDSGSKSLLLRHLRSNSFRSRLAQGALEGIRVLDDDSYAKVLRDVLAAGGEKKFPANVFGRGLNTLGYISRQMDGRTEVRKFITDYVNHPRRRIQTAAIGALGELGDERAIPVLQSFAGDDPLDRVQSTAKAALKKLREQTPLVPAEVEFLRMAADNLRAGEKKMKQELEEMRAIL